MEPDTVLGDSSLIPVPEPLTIMVTPCTEIQGPPEAYRNQSNPRGALLVANYSSFDSPDSTPRSGSEVDAEHITELFRQIGYENTKTIVDATKQDTGKALLEFRNEKIHAEVDSLVVVFMSHGLEDYMCTTDGEIIYDQEVIEYFNNVNCPALKGKPKYFIFQHCRGKKEHIVRAYKMIDNKTSRKISVPRKRNRRELSDVYVCYSTLPGFVSYRYDVHGSPYIDRICRVFMEEAHRKEIDTLMKRVEKAMPEAQPTEIRRLGFKSDFYFNPCSPRENALSVTCSDAMETEENIYETTSSPRGHVLIINNLGGCQQDVKKLHDIFTRLGYNVLPPRENLTKEEMEEVFCTFSQTPQYDSAVVIFYGKGFEDCIMSNDGKITTFQELVQTFNDVNCPSLSGRPKLFFINTVFTDDIQQDEVEAAHTECATRHSYRRDIVGQAGLSTDGTNDGTTDLDMAHSTMPVPAERDMYLLSVEVDGECKHGSLLTEAMYQVLIRFANSKELMALTKLILRTLDNLQQGNGVEERYHHEVRTYRFQRDYYFNPPKFIPIPDTPTKPRELKIPKVCFPKKINVRQVKQPKNTHSDYRNWSRPHGLALIISFEKYESEDLPNCPWRQNVANMLSELYSGLGYRTEICNNPTIAEAKARLEEFSNRGEHLNLDSLFVTILGLARDWDSFYCADGKPLHLSDVYSYFTEYSCPALKGKPKLFFLHMTELEEQKKPYESQRELKDTFVVRLSTKVSGTGDHPVAGLLAWRKALEEHAHDTHLESLISKAEMYLHDGASSNTVSNEHFAREVYGAPGKLFFNPSKV